MQTVKGIPVSPGIVIGRVFMLGEAETHVPRRDIDEHEIEGEIERLDAALRDAGADLVVLRDRTEQQLGREAAKIFGFHLGLVQDPALLGPMRERVRRDRINAEVAVADSFKKVTDQFKAIGNEVFRQKANDVLDLERRVLGKLMGENESRLSALTEPVIIIAHELTPSQTAGMDRKKILGIATDLGGRTSHTSIVARAIEIPCVVGCQRVMQRAEDGDLVIVDGDTGVVVVRPDERTLEEYRSQQDRFSNYRAILRETARLEAVTKDGTRIKLLGNIEFPHEVENVLANGGDGVGLYRTEFLYLTNDHEPSEDEQ
ncbi:MAG: Phosphoenolpyruvate-protein phosphotransferase, partial [Planctomycetota bacterium]